MKKINRKIPGEIPPAPKSEIDGKITDLASKTIPELCELSDRQLKLLNNKSFISKLQDKGAKIQTFYDKIMQELKAKQNEEQTCRMLSNLNLNNFDKNSVQQLEWSGEIKQKRDLYLDSDDDSDPEDVLQILSQSTAQEKVIKVLEPEKPLVTPEDLLNIGELPHVKYIVDKTEIKAKPKVSSQYKPYKTTKSDVHNPEKEINRIRNKHWEVTAATPPPIIHGPAKILSISESLKLQKEYNAHLKEIEAKHAAEKLIVLSGVKMGNLPQNKTNFKDYRNLDSDDDDDDESNHEGSDHEVHDDEPDRGGVIFTVMN